MFANCSSKHFNVQILCQIFQQLPHGASRHFVININFPFFVSYAPWFEMFYEVLNNISGADIRGEVSDFFASF